MTTTNGRPIVNALGASNGAPGARAAQAPSGLVATPPPDTPFSQGGKPWTIRQRSLYDAILDLRAYMQWLDIQVNGSTGLLPPPDYLTKTQADATYLTPAQGDARYMSLGAPVYTKDQADQRYVQNSFVGQPGGIAPLAPDGTIPAQYLPLIALTQTFLAANQAAMLALPAQQGDLAIRGDQNSTYILRGTDPTVLGNWQQLLTPPSVSSVNGKTGAVVLVPADIGAVSTADADVRYVLKAGDTFTGDVTIQDQLNLVGGHAGIWMRYDTDGPSAYRVYLEATTGGGELGFGPGGTSSTDTVLQRQAPGLLWAESALQASSWLGVWSQGGYVEIDAANSARTGALRLAPGQSVAWRNQAKTADLLLTTNATDQLTWQNRAISVSAQSGNSLIWNADGFYAPPGGGGSYLPLTGGTLTGNVEVNTPSTPMWFQVRYGSEPEPRARLNYDRVEFGPGATVTDAALLRITTGVLGVNCPFRPFAHAAYDLGFSNRYWNNFWTTNATFTNPPTYGTTLQPKITVNASAPSSPATGDLWIW